MKRFHDPITTKLLDIRRHWTIRFQSLEVCHHDIHSTKTVIFLRGKTFYCWKNIQPTLPRSIHHCCSAFKARSLQLARQTQQQIKAGSQEGSQEEQEKLYPRSYIPFSVAIFLFFFSRWLRFKRKSPTRDPSFWFHFYIFPFSQTGVSLGYRVFWMPQPQQVSVWIFPFRALRKGSARVSRSSAAER